MANELDRANLLSGWIIERREAFIPMPDPDLSSDLAALFVHHFERRAQAEIATFQNIAPADAAPNAKRLTVDHENLNSEPVVAFIKERRPRFVLSYGCHKLDGRTLTSVGVPFWNVHGGLSPWYRGVLTHFWPSYLLEPQMTGVTLHETTTAIDGGGIIHQTGVDLVSGDGLHDLACRAVAGFARELPSVMRRALNSSLPIAGQQQVTTGRIWTAAMWRPEHLLVIYKYFQDRIVDHCIESRLVGRVPKLVKLLEVTAQ